MSDDDDDDDDGDNDDQHWQTCGAHGRYKSASHQPTPDDLSQHLAPTKSSFTTIKFLGTLHHHKTHQLKTQIHSHKPVRYIFKCVSLFFSLGTKPVHEGSGFGRQIHAHRLHGENLTLRWIPANRATYFKVLGFPLSANQCPEAKVQ